MTTPLPSAAVLSNILTTQRALLDTLTSFLTVSIHHILYLRRIYPPVSFLSCRAYNYPVRQSRHPAVCEWINNAVTAIRDQFEKGTVENVAVCIFECDNNEVLERWTFDLRGFPVAGKRERDVPFENEPTVEAHDEPGLKRKINLADLEAQFRAVLSRVSVSAGKLKALPEGAEFPEYSFTVTIEVKDDADRPVGRLEGKERQWIAAEPDIFDSESEIDVDGEEGERQDKSRERSPRRLQKGKTVSVRRLEAGELRMEVWIEESKAKLDLVSSIPKSQKADSSFQSARFDPERGYDLEPADVNRKPQGGSSTDYRR